MIATAKDTPRWQFWIDRGGTFTDIVARRPDGQLVVHKLLSANPDRYQDAPIQGIRELMGIGPDQPIPAEQIAVVKMGTTVATNALLERQGDRTLLLITRGFRDALRIAYQNRPQIFARQIVLPELLYERVIEVEERYTAQGEELQPVNLTTLRPQLQAAYAEGLRACAIVLMHGYRYPDHEQQVANLAQQVGFTQISVSHQVSPLMKLVSRGDTTVVDAYLSPILRRYVDQVAGQLGETRLLFMQSNGGLVQAQTFQGKDSILSGPAGGIVGAVQTCAIAGVDRLISFDMGGTSTDIAHYNGEYERSFETEVAGVRLRTPMLSIHTVAAGGGSILHFDGARYRVGPQSAGANPGPTCYRRGGPLTVTDCNVMLGRLQPDYFPAVFGPAGNQPLDRQAVHQRFGQLATDIAIATGDRRTPEQVAAGFLAIAVEKMATAIKQVSVQRGYDVSTYTLCCFGGAGGQHACAIATALGMQQILIHPYAGVLSAYGMGLADLRVLKEQTIEAPLTPDAIAELEAAIAQLTGLVRQELDQQGVPGASIQIQVLTQVHLRYVGTDTALIVPYGTIAEMTARFHQLHQQRYGFADQTKSLMIEVLSVEGIGQMDGPAIPGPTPGRIGPALPLITGPMYVDAGWQDTPVFQREQLQPGDRIPGPALILEATGTNVVEPGWLAELLPQGHLRLQWQALPTPISGLTVETHPDPVRLEIFNHLFQAIAEQMGYTLQNTSHSVNIKERLDFSCALFDQQGQLVANAPHIPVHLGSMGESVQSLIDRHQGQFQPGDVYALNNPYNGGTHLPDITVITPVFAEPPGDRPLFYVASRGHHADIGGITPGSMPPHSTHIDQEGVLLDQVLLVSQGRFRTQALLELLTAGPYPARNPAQNLADLQAQIAANERGTQELQRAIAQFGLATVQAYMGFVQANAEAAVRQVLGRLSQQLTSNTVIYPLDNGSQIQVTVTLNATHRSAKIDFTGTSPQQSNNFNAPLSVCKAAVLYVVRTLVEDDIPLNAGCLTPLDIIVPVGCMLNPQYPAAVVAGNVETSQIITDALYGALGMLAASQGTMNNFTFGSDRHQYYETICGGSGAGPGFDGTSAVQTHMTNSRLTDPEVLEWRFPILVDQFERRHGSGGSGQYQGGDGVIRCLQFLAPMTAAILAGRRTTAPPGLRGGAPGAPGQTWIERQDGSRENLTGTAVMEMQPGDRFVIVTPGGGGFGPPRR